MFPNLQQVASLVVAQAPQGSCGQGGMDVFLMPLMMMLILYFIWLRPAARDRKQHASMLEGLKRGDEIVTNSGIIGSVADISERIITVEVARNVKVRILKSAIAKRLEAAEEVEDSKSEKKSEGKAKKSKS